MSLGLSRGARKSERLTVVMYEGLRAFLCIRCVAMDHCACVRACLLEYKKMCLAAFIEEEELKLHQHKEINHSCAVINNRVIRSLVPQQQIDQRSGYCFIPIVLKASVTALKKEEKNHPT